MSTSPAARLPAGRKGASHTAVDGHQVAEHSFLVRGRVAEVFGLLDPVSERDWVDDWDPTPIFPAELSREAGTVFTLERDGRLAVWTVLEHDPVGHVTAFLVVEHEYQHRWIRVHCEQEDDLNTRVSVSYTTTALSYDGERDLGRYGRDFLDAWPGAIQGALQKLAG